MDKRTKEFAKVMKGYGLTVEEGNKHFHIRKNGALVGTLAHTGEQNVYRQVVRDLVRDGVLPQEVKRLKFS